MPLGERFWSKVDRSAGPAACWTWTAARGRHGYGIFLLNGGCSLAHRVAWFIENGSMPDPGVGVLHTCDNPPCVNPSHLFTGTHLENMADRGRKGRAASWVTGAKFGRLTNDDVRDIRRLHGVGVAAVEIAHVFEVSRSSVYAITSGRNWSHVQ